MRVRALVDTGASGTAVDSKVIQALQVPATGSIQVHTPSTGIAPTTCNQYDLMLFILHPTAKSFLQIEALPVIDCDFSQQQFDMLIGRDVLAQCLFIYDGRAGIFSLAF